MGSMMDCFKARNTGNSPDDKKTQPPNQYQPPKINRVNDTDKAILDVKARMRKIKTYIDKINLQLEQQNQKVKDFLRDKSKQRALIALKHKKFLEKEVDKATGAQSMLQQTINNIESAQMDVNVMEALKVGDQVITELQSKASLEDFQELYDKHQEQKDRMEMEQDLFGQIMNDQELEDELNALEAEDIEMQIPSAPHTIIEVERQPERVEQKQKNQDRVMVPA